MRDVPLNALRALAAVYLAGGIRPAGRMLRIAHSAIARHLSELEAQVGAPIFDKVADRRGVVFTALGERLGREAAEAMTQLESSWQSARERRAANAVVISAAPSVAALWLLPRLPALAEAHPKLEVSVLSEQRVRRPEEEGCDIAIRMGEARADEVSEALMDDDLTPVLSPRLLARARTARGGAQLGLELLSELPLLHDRDPNAGWEVWVTKHGPAGLDLRQGPRFASSDLLLRAAQQGQGIALARLRLASDAIATGALVRLTENSVRLTAAYQLIGRSDRMPGHAVRTVWNWLLEDASREL
ncbi:MAG: LysR substrate-binding domain-containing protein [Pseudomonadota bacterium]